MNAPSQMSRQQASRIVQQYFEGTRPQKDWALETALKLQGVTLSSLELFKAAARKVTRGKDAFCILTPTGSGRHR